MIKVFTKRRLQLENKKVVDVKKDKEVVVNTIETTNEVVEKTVKQKKSKTLQKVNDIKSETETNTSLDVVVDGIDDVL